MQRAPAFIFASFLSASVACGDGEPSAGSSLTSKSLAGKWEITLVGEWRDLVTAPVPVTIRDVDGLFSAEASWEEREELSWDPGCVRVFQYHARLDETSDRKFLRVSLSQDRTYEQNCTLGQESRHEAAANDVRRETPVSEGLNGLWTMTDSEDSPCTLRIEGDAISVACPNAARNGSGRIRDDSLDFTSSRGGGFVLRRLDG